MTRWIYQLMGLLLFMPISGLSAQALSLPANLQGKIPFDLEKLAQAPIFQWENQQDAVWSLLYEGETYRDKQTEVFAYYASPATLRGDTNSSEKYPAIVAMHGGGGTAFAVWVRNWAKQGYAAIAMDLAGARPLPEDEQPEPWATKSTPLTNGAPDDTHVHKFFRVGDAFSEQWQFHAVANVIRAHSLIRSFPTTDSSRTALTGISWGGYLTNIIAGIDHRFKAAIPIYGCGFLQEHSAWIARFDSLGLETSKKWIELWDPSSFVGNAYMPMLFINGTNDFAYHVESWQKTIDLVAGAEQLLIVEMIHNHSEGATPPEIAHFVKQVFERNRATPRVGRPTKIANWYEASLTRHDEVSEAFFIYTKDCGANKERKWEVAPAQVKQGSLVGSAPSGVEAGYFLVIYGKDKLRLSGPVSFF